jgi:PAS domain S-box-containing protein
MELMSAILDHMEDAVVVTDSQGTFMLFNKKALSLSQ